MAVMELIDELARLINVDDLDADSIASALGVRELTDEIYFVLYVHRYGYCDSTGACPHASWEKARDVLARLKYG